MFNYENHRSIIKDYIYHQNDKNLEFSFHSHNSYEFIYCHEGEIEISIENTSYVLTTGKCLLIQPLATHSYHTESYSKTYLCVFSYSFIPDFYENYKDKSPSNVIFSLSNPTKLIEILQKNENVYSVKSVLYQILSSLIKNNTFYHVDSADHNLLKRIIEYVSDNYIADITLHSLCEKFGFSYNYISSFFMKHLHTSFCNMVNSYRIYKAQQLLRSTQKSIIEIAYACGFNSLRSFNRNFIKLSKQTPSNYKASINSVEWDTNKQEQLLFQS